MKANELRIGNWIEGIKMENPIRIINDSIAYNYYNERFEIDAIDIKYYKPIPLTEEWLLRFGFKKNEPEISDGYFNWWNKEKSVSVDVEYVLTDNGVELLYYYVLQDINGCRPYKHIIYVHQLQNLYFALTGEELTLK